MKAILTLIVIVLNFKLSASETPKKVLMMVSEGFNAIEYYTPYNQFKLAGFEVKTATKYNRAVRPDERQVSQFPAVKGDLTFEEIDANDFDAVVFAGGNGAWEDFFPNEAVHKVLVNFLNSEKLVALLCSSTGLLGVANNLSGSGQPIAVGRKVTGYKRVKGILIQLGKVNYDAGEEGKPFVVVDGNLITGRDPMSSELFAKTIVERL